MATKQYQSLPIPEHPRPLSNVVSNGAKAWKEDPRIVVIVYNKKEQESVLPIVADVLGKPYSFASSFATIVGNEHGSVVGIAADDARPCRYAEQEQSRNGYYQHALCESGHAS